MNLSNRIRGAVLRIQIIQNKILQNIRIFALKNSKEVRAEKNKILLYSDKNSIVKEDLPNSILNPLTNSLSPSEKS